MWIVPNGDMNRARQITSGSGRYLRLRWTPDDRIVYESDAGGGFDIWIMDPDGRNQTRLTANDGNNMMPSVSPDGRYIAYIAVSYNSGGGAGVHRLWRMDIDGGNPKQLTDGPSDNQPAWSGDGKSLLYTSWMNPKPAIWRVSGDGGGATQMWERAASLPVPSPDGKLVAACLSDNGNKVGLLRYDSGQLVMVLDIEIPQFDLLPVYRWAPNGKALTYIGTREGISNVWSQPLDGRPPKQITDFKTDEVVRFDWSRDGKQLACIRNAQTWDVMLLRDLKPPEKP
jgi:Tol biopolymer transport system component